jgi:hypothetical protein
MGAITMPSTTSLLNKLRRDYPDLTFAEGADFRWSPSERTVFYAPQIDFGLLLHEVAHARLGHGEYSLDIELLHMERDAWEYAKTELSKTYSVVIEEEQVEHMLDTYRDWLHARSTCPTCQATGLQTKPNQYSCLACGESWRVNEARTCALRRYKMSDKQE